MDRDFDKLLAAEPMPGTLAVDPAGPALIAFTSGTTRDPKGVVHSHQTLGFETGQLAGLYPPDRGHQLTSAPVGHFIGMINAFLIPVLDGTPVNLADAWDPAVVLGLIRTDRLTVGGGAPYYLTTLIDHPDFAPDEHLRHMKYAGLGGAPVPAGDHRAAGRARHDGVPFLRQHRAPVGHRFPVHRAGGQAAVHRRRRAARRGDPARARTARSSAGGPTCAWATPTRT